ncbi:MAG: DUF423 domain-containing protein [Balneolaceae bacterium]|nr:DUF423 domain-containing protein [Balneolaceae bacterium]
MSKVLFLSGSAAMALAVMLGAFGAHALRGRLDPDMLETFTTGVTYHFYHALGLLILGIAAQYLPESPWLRWSGWLMGAGIVLFSGSLYLMAFTGARWLGAVTPIGGMAFILAWLLFFGAVWKGM